MKCMVFFFTITIIVALCAGCTTKEIPAGQSPSVPVQGGGKVSLQAALDALSSSDQSRGSTPVKILYIRGDSLDPAGAAKEWTIGVRQGEDGFFYIYNQWGGSTVTWPGKLPGQEIIPERFMQPGDLIAGHKLLIQDITDGGTSPIDELELRDGVYRISIQSAEGLKEYTFEAASGKEITTVL